MQTLRAKKRYRMIDYFLSHASEDKPFVREIFTALKGKGYHCWFDEAEILPGDSLVDKVFREGLKASKLVILFLSKAFLSKGWPKAELETAIAKQIRLRKKTVIPFMIDITHEELVDQYPFFESIYCGSVNKGFELMITQLESLIIRDTESTSAPLNTKSSDVNKIESNYFDFDKIIQLPALQEVSRLKETFHISYHRAPKDILVEIIQLNEKYYYGVCNYGFWGPEQATPYKSMHPQSTISDALNDAIEGIDAFDSAEYPNELVFWVSDDDIIYDGNGLKISKDEAYKRRAQITEPFRKVSWTNTTMNGGPWWLVSKNFTNKEFSVIGPIDDDSEYIEKCMEIQSRGIDFRLETVPVNKQSKAALEQYFIKEYSFRLINNDDLYK